MASDETEPLRSYLKPTAPLGPSDAAQITDVEVAARLFDPHNKSFNSLLRRDLSVVIGRRGSGKTALLNSYKYRPYLVHLDRTTQAPGFDLNEYQIVIEIVAHKQFMQMQKIVAEDPRVSTPVEEIVDRWNGLILDYFFAQLLLQECPDEICPGELADVQRYLFQDDNGYQEEVRRMVWGPPLLGFLRNLIHREHKPKRTPLTQDGALAAAVSFLKSTHRRAVMIFDSMDEYDITNPVLNRTVGALLRFIAHFNARQDRIKIKLCLPSEIFPEIQRASANPLKDLVSVDQVHWSAMELAQIAAYRYRLFLSLYDPAMADKTARFNLNKREGVKQFWSSFFEDSHTNKYGNREEPLTYILRHTQLLPRQALMLIQKIIVLSADRTGGFRYFSSDCISAAVENVEPLIASEILRAFEQTYPIAEALGKAIFVNFPTVFNYDQLEDRWRKKGRRLLREHAGSFDIAEFGEMLVRIGIVGLLQEEKDLYFETRFGYDSLAPPNIGEGHELCLHPIFSRHFNAAPNKSGKVILPLGVSISV